jgi:hypothetical protein
MTLSLRQASPNRAGRTDRDRGKGDDRVTIGEMVGDLLEEEDEGDDDEE